MPESAAIEAPEIKFLPLKPARFVPLVMVWAREGDDPAVTAFRNLADIWLREGRLFPENTPD